MPRQNTMRRFIRNVLRGGATETGCWLWPERPTTGYASILHEGRQIAAHRFAYIQLVGPIPDGHEIHHRCGNKSCVAPHHLEAVTHSVNVAASAPHADRPFRPRRTT